MHVARRHQGHAGGFADHAQLLQPFEVVPGAEQFSGQPDVSTEKGFSPMAQMGQGLGAARARGHQQQHAVLEGTRGDLIDGQTVLPFGAVAPEQGDELAQVAVPIAVAGQRDQFEGRHIGLMAGRAHGELAADQQFQQRHRVVIQVGLSLDVFQGRMGPHHPRQRAFIGDGQRAVAQLAGPLHQLGRMRSPALEAEMAQTVQLGVGGQRVAVHQPYTPCRNQCAAPWPSAAMGTRSL